MAVLIAWTIGGGSEGYIWQIGPLSTILRPKVLVNALILSLGIWFGLGLLGVDPKGPQGKVGLVVVAIFVSFYVALDIGDHWIWDTKNFEGIKDYLLGKEIKVTEKNSDGSVSTYVRGGILTFDTSKKPANYRLIIFPVSAFIIGWFFITYLGLDKHERLSWAMAIILAAALTRRGTSYEIVIGMAELFLFLIIAKGITIGSGTVGNIISWLVSIAIVEFIFRTVFGHSGLIAALNPTFNWATNLPFVGKLFYYIGVIISWFTGAPMPTPISTTSSGTSGITSVAASLAPGGTSPTAPATVSASVFGTGKDLFARLAALISVIIFITIQKFKEAGDKGEENADENKESQSDNLEKK